MNIERFVERKNKNSNSENTYCGGSWCVICSEYNMGGSYSCGSDGNGGTIESYSDSNTKMINGICKYCIEDLRINIEYLQLLENYKNK